MPKETINPIDAAIDAFEDYYARIGDPASFRFPLSFIRLGMSLATNDYARMRNPRVIKIVAAVYRRLTADERLSFADVNVASDILEAVELEGSATWPEALGAVEFRPPQEEELEAFKLRRIAALRLAIDRLAGQVISGGDRMVMTQISQVMEARAILFGQHAGESPSAEEFPHIDAYRQIKGLPSLTDAAQVILGLATAWGQANAALELVRARASAGMASAESAETVETLYAAAVTQADEIVGRVLQAIQ